MSVTAERLSGLHFNHALVRAPAASVVRGLRAVDRGSPAFAGVRSEFEAYVTALEVEGVLVETLPALDEFPDSIFVEDPALVFPRAPSCFGRARRHDLARPR